MSESRFRVTVLMAIYNCAPTLVDALDSLMAQTFQEFKVVLCDDCSIDDTYKIAKEYVSRYPDKFVLLRNETNKKLPYTLNRCLEYADTEYVARMDGDDLSKPERFKREIDFLDSNPQYALVSCPMEFFNEAGVFMTGKAEEIPTKRTFIYDTPFAHAPVMIRTKIMREVGGYTVASWTQRGQDVHLWAKIMSQGYFGYNIQEVLYMMRDDLAAYKRRTIKHAVLSLKRGYEIYKLVKIPKRYYYRLLRPLIVTAAPRVIYDFFHVWKRRKNKD